MEIKEARKNIDEIDAILVENYKKRLELVGVIGKYKDEHQLPINDEARDKEIVHIHVDCCEDSRLKPYVESYIQAVIDMSNEYLREHMHQHIFLIGMPGAGKTTVGKALANELHRDFYDLDAKIQEKTGKSIQNIIIYDGEEVFRQYEYDAIRELIHSKPSVIATGGGTVMSEKTVQMIRNNSLVFFVNPDVTHILDDLDLEIRPLVKESIEYIFRLYEERYPLYESVSHIKIGNENSIADTVQAIIEALPNSEK